MHNVQVYVSYGPKTNGQLLLSYGFAPKPGTNPHDAYCLKVCVKEDDLAKVACLQQLGVPASMEFPLRLSGMPESLLPYIAFARAHVSPEDVDLLADYLFNKVHMVAWQTSTLVCAVIWFVVHIEGLICNVWSLTTGAWTCRECFRASTEKIPGG